MIYMIMAIVGLVVAVKLIAEFSKGPKADSARISISNALVARISEHSTERPISISNATLSGLMLDYLKAYSDLLDSNDMRERIPGLIAGFNSSLSSLPERKKNITNLSVSISAIDADFPLEKTVRNSLDLAINEYFVSAGMGGTKKVMEAVDSALKANQELEICPSPSPEDQSTSASNEFVARALIDYAFKYNEPHPTEIKAAIAANIDIDRYKTEVLMLRAFVIDFVIVGSIMMKNLEAGKAIRQAYCDAWQSIGPIFPLFIERMNSYDTAMKNGSKPSLEAISDSIPTQFVSHLANEIGEIPDELKPAATFNFERTYNETSELINRLVDNKLLVI